MVLPRHNHYNNATQLHFVSARFDIFVQKLNSACGLYRTKSTTTFIGLWQPECWISKTKELKS